MHQSKSVLTLAFNNLHLGTLYDMVMTAYLDFQKLVQNLLVTRKILLQKRVYSRVKCLR